MDSFSLYQPGILDLLKSGGAAHDGTTHEADEFFCTAINRSFVDIAEQFGCDINLTKRRLTDVRPLWIQDVRNIRMEESKDPNHLKQVGFLAYWLRRRVVIQIVHEKVGMPVTEPMKDFLKYGNDICAFLTGFRIALFFEIEKKFGPPRLEQLRLVNLDYALVREIAVLLYHKNVSPHALYLIFRGLFYPLVVPRPDFGNIVPLKPRLVST